jgi:hypothetical protein
LPQASVRLRIRCAATLALLPLVAACGGKEEPTSKAAAVPAPAAEPASAASAAAPAAPATGSSAIAGRAVYEGAPPRNPTFRMSADATCAKSHPGEVTKDEIVVGKEGGLSNVFVRVASGISGTYPPPATPVVLDQKGCLYVPHVFGILVGQPLEIVNSDDTLHNVHSLAETNDPFNVGMPKEGMRVRRTFDKPEVMVKIKCDVHGWMSAYAGVVPNPFFAVSGKDGRFEIPNLPAGTYTLEAWHEKLGRQTQQVTVGEKETKPVTFTFRAGD